LCLPWFDLMVDDVVEDELGDVVVVVEVEDDVVVVVGGGGPVDTTIATELPGATEAPGPGTVEMIWPAPYWVDDWLDTPPTLRPAWVNRV
jgi:hypothetical protein